MARLKRSKASAAFLVTESRGFVEVVGDLEDAGSVCGQGGDVFGYVLPVDACSAGPEVVVFLAVVVVKV